MLTEGLIILALVVFVFFIRIVRSINMSLHFAFDSISRFEVPHKAFALATGREMFRSELDLCFVSLSFDVVVDLLIVYLF
jgi:hypothetical protein